MKEKMRIIEFVRKKVKGKELFSPKPSGSFQRKKQSPRHPNFTEPYNLLMNGPD